MVSQVQQMILYKILYNLKAVSDEMAFFTVREYLRNTFRNFTLYLGTIANNTSRLPTDFMQLI